MKNNLKDDSLYKLVSPVAQGLGMAVVDVQKMVFGIKETKVVITVKSKDSDTSIDQLETFHRAVQSLLEVTIGRDVLSMEVGTPGLTRNIRDVSEFELFKGKEVKVFSSSKETWYSGIIDSVADEFVNIKTGKGEVLPLGFEDIKKAKLIFS